MVTKGIQLSNIKNRNPAFNSKFKKNLPNSLFRSNTTANLIKIKKNISKRSLFIFSNDSEFRLNVLNIVNSSWFLKTMNIINIISSIFLIFETNESVPYIADVLTKIFVSIFFCEFMMKIIAYGFVLDENSYLRDPWNFLDMLVCFSGLISLLPQISDNLFMVRSLRIIRPMKVVFVIPNMKSFIYTLIFSMLDISAVFMILFFFFILFALLGLSLWSDIHDFRCRVEPFPVNGSLLIDDNFPKLCGGINTCNNKPELCLSSKTLYSENKFFMLNNLNNLNEKNFKKFDSINKNSGINNIVDFNSELYYPSLNYGITTFRNFLNSLYIVFQATTTEGWTDIMYMVMDANNYYLSVFYFFLLIIINNFFLLNLTVAVLLYNFEKNAGWSTQEVLYERIIYEENNKERRNSSLKANGDSNAKKISIRSPAARQGLNNEFYNNFKNSAFANVENNEKLVLKDNIVACDLIDKKNLIKVYDVNNNDNYSSNDNNNNNLLNSECANHESNLKLRNSNAYNNNTTTNNISSVAYFNSETNFINNKNLLGISKNKLQILNMKTGASKNTNNDNNTSSLMKSREANFIESKKLSVGNFREEINENKNFNDVNLTSIIKININNKPDISEYKDNKKTNMENNIINNDNNNINLIKTNNNENNNTCKNINSDNNNNNTENFEKTNLSASPNRNKNPKNSKRLSLLINNGKLAQRLENSKKSYNKRQSLHHSNNKIDTIQEQIKSEQSLMKKYKKKYKKIKKLDQTKAISTFQINSFSDFIVYVKSIKFLIQIKPTSNYHLKHCFSFYCYYILNQPVVQFVFYGCILMNSLILTLDRTDQPDEEIKTMEDLNIFLVSIFALENFLMFIALGPKRFVSDFMNLWDSAVVSFSVIELTIINRVSKDSEKSGTSIGSVFRILRILRLFKLIRSWGNFKIMMQSIFETMKRMINYFLLLCLFIYIYALIGCNLFKNSLRFDPETNKYNPNADSNFDNFDNFQNSVLSVFYLFIGDGWYDTFFNCFRSELNNKAAAVIYFISIVLFMQISLVNIFLAYLIDNFKLARKFLHRNVKVKSFMANINEFALKKHHFEYLKQQKTSDYTSTILALMDIYVNQKNKKHSYIESKITLNAKVIIDFGNFKATDEIYFNKLKRMKVKIKKDSRSVDLDTLFPAFNAVACLPFFEAWNDPYEIASYFFMEKLQLIVEKEKNANLNLLTSFEDHEGNLINNNFYNKNENENENENKTNFNFNSKTNFNNICNEHYLISNFIEFDYKKYSNNLERIDEEVDFFSRNGFKNFKSFNKYSSLERKSNFLLKKDFDNQEKSKNDVFIKTNKELNAFQNEHLNYETFEDKENSYFQKIKIESSSNSKNNNEKLSPKSTFNFPIESEKSIDQKKMFFKEKQKISAAENNFFSNDANNQFLSESSIYTNSELQNIFSRQTTNNFDYKIKIRQRYSMRSQNNTPNSQKFLDERFSKNDSIKNIKKNLNNFLNSKDQSNLGLNFRELIPSRNIIRNKSINDNFSSNKINKMINNDVSGNVLNSKSQFFKISSLDIKKNSSFLLSPFMLANENAKRSFKSSERDINGSGFTNNNDKSSSFYDCANEDSNNIKYRIKDKYKNKFFDKNNFENLLMHRNNNFLKIEEEAPFDSMRRNGSFRNSNNNQNNSSISRNSNLEINETNSGEKNEDNNFITLGNNQNGKKKFFSLNPNSNLDKEVIESNLENEQQKNQLFANQENQLSNNNKFDFAAEDKNLDQNEHLKKIRNEFEVVKKSYFNDKDKTNNKPVAYGNDNYSNDLIKKLEDVPILKKQKNRRMFSGKTKNYKINLNDNEIDLFNKTKRTNFRSNNENKNNNYNCQLNPALKASQEEFNFIKKPCSKLSSKINLTKPLEEKEIFALNNNIINEKNFPKTLNELNNNDHYNNHNTQNINFIDNSLSSENEIRFKNIKKDRNAFQSKKSIKSPFKESKSNMNLLDKNNFNYKNEKDSRRNLQVDLNFNSFRTQVLNKDDLSINLSAGNRSPKILINDNNVIKITSNNSSVENSNKENLDKINFDDKSNNFLNFDFSEEANENEKLQKSLFSLKKNKHISKTNLNWKFNSEKFLNNNFYESSKNQLQNIDQSFWKYENRENISNLNNDFTILTQGPSRIPEKKKADKIDKNTNSYNYFDFENVSEKNKHINQSRLESNRRTNKILETFIANGDALQQVYQIVNPLSSNDNNDDKNDECKNNGNYTRKINWLNEEDCLSSNENRHANGNYNNEEIISKSDENLKSDIEYDYNQIDFDIDFKERVKIFNNENRILLNNSNNYESNPDIIIIRKNTTNLDVEDNINNAHANNNNNTYDIISIDKINDSKANNKKNNLEEKSETREFELKLFGRTKTLNEEKNFSSSNDSFSCTANKINENESIQHKINSRYRFNTKFLAQDFCESENSYRMGSSVIINLKHPRKNILNSIRNYLMTKNLMNDKNFRNLKIFKLSPLENIMNNDEKINSDSNNSSLSLVHTEIFFSPEKYILSETNNLCKNNKENNYNNKADESINNNCTQEDYFFNFYKVINFEFEKLDRRIKKNLQKNIKLWNDKVLEESLEDFYENDFLEENQKIEIDINKLNYKSEISKINKVSTKGPLGKIKTSLKMNNNNNNTSKGLYEENKHNNASNYSNIRHSKSSINLVDKNKINSITAFNEKNILKHFFYNTKNLTSNNNYNLNVQEHESNNNNKNNNNINKTTYKDNTNKANKTSCNMTIINKVNKPLESSSQKTQDVFKNQTKMRPTDRRNFMEKLKRNLTKRYSSTKLEDFKKHSCKYYLFKIYNYCSQSSLGILHHDSYLRKLIMKLVFNRKFDFFIMVVIVFNTILLIFDTPWNDPNGLLAKISGIANFTFTIIFVLEALLKILGFGLIFHYVNPTKRNKLLHYFEAKEHFNKHFTNNHSINNDNNNNNPPSNLNVSSSNKSSYAGFNSSNSFLAKNSHLGLINHNNNNNQNFNFNLSHNHHNSNHSNNKSNSNNKHLSNSLAKIENQTLNKTESNKDSKDEKNLNSRLPSQTIDFDTQISLLNKDSAYLHSISNCIDFFVVILGLIDILDDSSQIDAAKYFKTLRLIRSLRPIRIFTKNNNLKIILSCLLKSIPAIGSTFIICGVFIYIYIIIGIGLYKAELTFICSLDNYFSEADCVAAGGSWVYNYENFDNFINAFRTLFGIMMVQGWVDVANFAYRKTNNFISYLYFITFIIFGYLFVLNLIISVVIEKYKTLKNKNSKLFTLSDEEKEWIKVQKIMLKFKPIPKIDMEHASDFKKKLYKSISTKNFENSITLLILFSMVLLIIQYNGASDKYNFILDFLNYIINFIFNLELIVKLYVFRSIFFYSNWNKIDFFIIFLCNAIMIFNIMQYLSLIPSDNKFSNFAYIFRAFRILRVIRLMTVYSKLRGIIDTLIYLVPSIMNIGTIMLIILVIYGCIGVNLFSTLPLRENFHELNNFKDFTSAFVLLFKILTGESWNSMMFEAAYHDCTGINSSSSNDFNFSAAASKDYFCETYKNLTCTLSDSISYTDLISGKGYSCGSDVSYLYFISFMIVGPIFIMNLCIVMVVEGFSESMYENESLLSQEEMDNFISVWINYDTNFKKKVHPHELVLILKQLQPPLGFNYDRFYIIDPIKLNYSLKKVRRNKKMIGLYEKIFGNEKPLIEDLKKLNKSEVSKVKCEHEEGNSVVKAIKGGENNNKPVIFNDLVDEKNKNKINDKHNNYKDFIADEKIKNNKYIKELQKSNQAFENFLYKKTGIGGGVNKNDFKSLVSQHFFKNEFDEQFAKQGEENVNPQINRLINYIKNGTLKRLKNSYEIQNFFFSVNKKFWTTNIEILQIMNIFKFAFSEENKKTKNNKKNESETEIIDQKVSFIDDGLYIHFVDACLALSRLVVSKKNTISLDKLRENVVGKFTQKLWRSKYKNDNQVDSYFGKNQPMISEKLSFRIISKVKGNLVERLSRARERIEIRRKKEQEELSKVNFGNMNNEGKSIFGLHRVINYDLNNTILKSNELSYYVNAKNSNSKNLFKRNNFKRSEIEKNDKNNFNNVDENDRNKIILDKGGRRKSGNNNNNVQFNLNFNNKNSNNKNIYNENENYFNSNPEVRRSFNAKRKHLENKSSGRLKLPFARSLKSLSSKAENEDHNTVNNEKSILYHRIYEKQQTNIEFYDKGEIKINEMIKTNNK